MQCYELRKVRTREADFARQLGTEMKRRNAEWRGTRKDQEKKAAQMDRLRKQVKELEESLQLSEGKLRSEEWRRVSRDKEEKTQVDYLKKQVEELEEGLQVEQARRERRDKLLEEERRDKEAALHERNLLKLEVDGLVKDLAEQSDDRWRRMTSAMEDMQAKLEAKTREVDKLKLQAVKDSVLARLGSRKNEPGEVGQNPRNSQWQHNGELGSRNLIPIHIVEQGRTKGGDLNETQSARHEVNDQDPPKVRHKEDSTRRFEAAGY